MAHPIIEAPSCPCRALADAVCAFKCTGLPARCAAGGCRYRPEGESAFCGRHAQHQVNHDLYVALNLRGDRRGMNLLLEVAIRRDGTCQLNRGGNGAAVDPDDLSYGFRGATLLAWADDVRPHLPILDNALQAQLHDGGLGIKTLDQIQRAEKLAELFDPERHRTVIMLEGHGRILVRFIDAVVRRLGPDALDRVRIVVRDIKRSVTAWHKKWFRCPHIVCEDGDILAQPDIGPASLLYLNFCSLGGQAMYNRVVTFARRHAITFLISFSVIRNAKGLKDLFDSEKREDDGLHMALLDTGRKDFLTFVVSAGAELVAAAAAAAAAVLVAAAAVAAAAAAEAEADGDEADEIDLQHPQPPETAGYKIVRFGRAYLVEKARRVARGLAASLKALQQHFVADFGISSPTTVRKYMRLYEEWVAARE